MAKEQNAEAREKQIKANRKKSVDEARKQLGIPQKKTREDLNQADSRIASNPTNKK